MLVRECLLPSGHIWIGSKAAGSANRKNPFSKFQPRPKQEYAKLPEDRTCNTSNRRIGSLLKPVKHNYTNIIIIMPRSIKFCEQYKFHGLRKLSTDNRQKKCKG